MKTLLMAAVVAALCIAHQDWWFWRSAGPMALGFIPIGLSYHACFTVAVSALMWMLVKWAWPSHLEHEAEQEVISGRIGAQEGDAR